MEVLLSTHIVVASISILSVIVAAWRTSRYWRLASWSGIGLTVVSGAGLLLAMPGVSLARLCGLTSVLIAVGLVAELRARQRVDKSAVVQL